MLSQSPRELFEPTPTRPRLKPFAMPPTNRGWRVCVNSSPPSTYTETVRPATTTFRLYQVFEVTPLWTEPCPSYTHPLAVLWPRTTLFDAASRPANLKSVGEK